MSPLDKGESLSPYVSRIINIIDNSSVKYRLTAMSTILEGDYDEVMQLVHDCFKELEKDCGRISLHLKMDYRKGTHSRIESKMDKIEALLERKIRR